MDINVQWIALPRMSKPAVTCLAKSHVDSGASTPSAIQDVQTLARLARKDALGEYFLVSSNKHF